MTRWMSVFLMSVVILFGWVQSNAQASSRDRYAITAQQVAQTISGKGVSIADLQVSMLANVVAAEPHPVLDILAVEPLGDESQAGRSEARTFVKMTCHNPSICLPFYAAISRPKELTSASIDKSHSAPALDSTILNSKTAVTMRTGTRATLVMNSERSHIQISVVSLENGVVGRKIRVASPDHRQVYFAEVVNAHLLKRNF